MVSKACRTDEESQRLSKLQQKVRTSMKTMSEVLSLLEPLELLQLQQLSKYWYD